jgi:hypothetical protein
LQTPCSLCHYRGKTAPGLRGDIHGLEAGCAEAVELNATDGARQAGRDDSGACDVHALVTDRGDYAEDHVGDAIFLQVGEPGAQLLDQADQEVDRLDRMQ